ncbi:MAG: hypothetical protein J6X11_11670 [Treponema sp.]|nr:hypothetical protein [Treponema sp.]
MRTDTSIKDADDAVELLSARGNISFKNVSFSYNEKNTVLENINLEIGAGEHFAFVGGSGGGKTTICGSHQELLSLGKKYADLWKSQTL